MFTKSHQSDNLCGMNRHAWLAIALSAVLAGACSQEASEQSGPVLAGASTDAYESVPEASVDYPSVSTDELTPGGEYGASDSILFDGAAPLGNRLVVSLEYLAALAVDELSMLDTQSLTTLLDECGYPVDDAVVVQAHEFHCDESLGLRFESTPDFIRIRSLSLTEDIGCASALSLGEATGSCRLHYMDVSAGPDMYVKYVQSESDPNLTIVDLSIHPVPDFVDPEFISDFCRAEMSEAGFQWMIGSPDYCDVRVATFVESLL